MGLFDIFKRNGIADTAISVRANKVADVIESIVGTIKASPSDYRDKVIARFVQRRMELIRHMEEQNWTIEEQRERGERGLVATAGTLQFPSHVINSIEEVIQGECLAYLWLESRAGGSRRVEAAHAILEEIASRY